MLKRKHSKETIEKIRTAMIGKKKSKETMIKISETLAKKQKKNQSSYRSFAGHVSSIYQSVEKYAHHWKIPISDIGEFRNWSYRDVAYEELFNIWKENGFNKFDVPVVMRSIKKYGFVIDNLSWKRKGEYSWWGEEYEVLKGLQDDVSNKQPIENEGTEGQKEIVRKSMKGRRFKK